MATRFPDLFRALADPFGKDEVKTKPGGGGRQLKYITARTVMNRLDEVAGPEGWWDEYAPLEHSVICRLTIRLPDGSTVTKCDAGGYAGMSDQGDDDKSGFSDAFKRAAAKFGVGRHLYGDGVPTFAREPAEADPEPEPEPEREAPDPARHRAKLKALAEISVHYGVFASAAVKDARDDFYARVIDATIVVPPEEEKKLPNVHQLGWHLSKWLAEKGWCKRLPPGKSTPDNNRYLAQYWNGADKKARAAIRMEARRYLAAEFDEVYHRLAGRGDAYEAPAEQAADAGSSHG